MNAFEQFEKWCEEFLPVGSYQIVPESKSYQQTAYLDIGSEEMPFLCFEQDGAFCCAGVLTEEDMLEHIRDLEMTDKQREEI